MPAIAQEKKPVNALGILAEIDVVLARHKKTLAQQITLPLEEKTRQVLTTLGIKTPSQELVSQIASTTAKNTINTAGEAQTASDFGPIMAKEFTDAALNNPDVSKKISDLEKVYAAAQKETADIVSINSKDLETAAVLTGLSQIAKLENPTSEIAETISASTEDLARIQAPLASTQDINDLKSQISEYTSAYPQKLTQELSSFSIRNLPTLDQLQKAKDAAHASAVAEMKFPKTDSRFNVNDIVNQIGSQLKTTSTTTSPNILSVPLKKPGITDSGMKLMLKFSSGAQKEAYFSLLAYDKSKLDKAITNNQNVNLFKEAQNFAVQKPKKLTQYLAYFQNTYGLDNSSFIIWESTGQLLSGSSAINQRDIPQKSLGILSSTKGSVSGIRGAMNAAKLLRAGATAAEATNPAGWIMLAAQFAPQLANLIKKAAAALAAVAGWLLFTFGLKLLGAIAGAVAGATLGATIGFFVAGPVGAIIGGAIGGTIGAAIGWLRPLETINFVRNPSLIVTAPANFIQGIFSSIGSGAASIGSSLIGATSTAWGAVTGAVGTSIGAIGSGISSLLSGLSAASVSGTAIFVPLAIGTGAISITSIVLGIFTGSAFFSTDQPTGPIIAGQNQYFSLTKTVTGPSHLENSALPTNISFHISLTAKVNLNNIQVSDELRAQTKNGNVPTATDSNGKPISPPCADNLPQTLAVNQTWTCDLSITASQNFADSFTVNTVTVKATPEGQKEIADFATATATIGNPPTICAIVDFQGPWSGNEKNNVLQACQAFDLSPKAVSLLQNAGKIILLRVSDGALGNNVCGMVTGANQISVGCSLGAVSFARYVINHEMGHVISNFNGSTYNQFLNSGVFSQEGLMPTYPIDVRADPTVGPNESFAEMVTEYMNSKDYNHPPRAWSNYPGGPWNNPGNGYKTFIQDKPLHYNFAKNNIFGGITY